MVQRLHRFLRLPASEQWLLMKVALLLEIISLGMWLLPFRVLRRIMTEQATTLLRPRCTNRAPVERVVWAVETASRSLPGGKTCLTQALAAQFLLTRRGYPATFHIGVGKDELGRFQAHAWVESQGEAVIGGHELERYSRLLELKGSET